MTVPLDVHGPARRSRVLRSFGSVLLLGAALALSLLSIPGCSDLGTTGTEAEPAVAVALAPRELLPSIDGTYGVTAILTGFDASAVIFDRASYEVLSPRGVVVAQGALAAPPALQPGHRSAMRYRFEFSLGDQIVGLAGRLRLTFWGQTHRGARLVVSGEAPMVVGK